TSYSYICTIKSVLTGPEMYKKKGEKDGAEEYKREGKEEQNIEGKEYTREGRIIRRRIGRE
ncbi:MAG: hypothetical protein ACK559_14455, partial [bacterium]